MRRLREWVCRNRLALGLSSLSASAGFAALVVIAEVRAVELTLVYVAVVVTISLVLDVLGAGR